MSTKAILLSVLLAATTAACGDDGPGTGPITAADAEPGCRSGCERDAMCDPEGETVEACTADCVSDVAGWVRADAFESITDCIAALACTASDDACVTTCSPTSAHETYEARCREVFAACGSAEEVGNLCETTPTTGGDTGFLCLVTPAIMDEFTACIPAGTDCKTGLACIQAAAGAHGIDL